MYVLINFNKILLNNLEGIIIPNTINRFFQPFQLINLLKISWESFEIGYHGQL